MAGAIPAPGESGGPVARDHDAARPGGARATAATDAATLHAYRSRLRNFYRAWVDRSLPLIVAERGVSTSDFATRPTMPELRAADLAEPARAVVVATLLPGILGMLLVAGAFQRMRRMERVL